MDHGADDSGERRLLVRALNAGVCVDRLVRDFSEDGARLVVDAEGDVVTIVNGEVLLEDGKPAGALPGHVIRGA